MGAPGQRGERGATADDGPPPGALPAEEQAVLDAFDRMAPQGTLPWDFEAALRRFEDRGALLPRPRPWFGLPDDLWDRGRGARAAERMLGDVLTVAANLLAEDTRQAVMDATEGVAEATWDALRHLAGRVERLESGAAGLTVEPAVLDLPDPDAAEWVDLLPGWLPADGSAADLPVVVGEAGRTDVVTAVVATGRPTIAVDPRADRIRAAAGTGAAVELADVADHLRRRLPGSLGAVVVSGTVDRASLAGKADLVDQALRALVPGGILVVLATDQASWESALDPVAADLAPGRPLRPETWALVLPRRPVRPVVQVAVHPAARGTVHAVVAEAGR